MRKSCFDPARFVENPARLGWIGRERGRKATLMVPMLLSVAMLAAIVLTVGGGWLIVARRDIRRGVLMSIAGLVILGNVLIWTV